MGVRGKRFGPRNDGDHLVIRVRELTSEERDYKGAFPEAWLAEELKATPLKPKPGAKLAVTLAASRHERTVMIRGNLATELVAACSRCARELPLQVRAEVTLALVPRRSREADDSEDGERGIADEELSETYSGDLIDPTEHLREQLMLALPDYPVCRDDCRGLCARCGRDLNREECVCPPGDHDSPFAALKKIRLS